MEVTELGSDPRGRVLWPVAALGLLTAGWAVFLLAQGHADQLQERWGSAPDVVDALSRDAYVSRRTLPYFSAVLVLDGLVAVSLVARSRRGWPLAVKVSAGVSLVPSVGLHGFVWLVYLCFAA